ncbi:MAG: glycosyltransferase family 4 protein [Proteobacteria bacterium]|nr:glycosyltransferase family 4 protein [Pseudomonadota bacterium]
MRIAFDYQTFFLQPYGGISRYFTQLVQNLLKKEQQVKVFAPLYQNNYLPKLPKDIVNGWHVGRYPSKTRRICYEYNFLKSRFQISRWKPDLVHETYFSKKKVAPKSCPTVITVYDMIYELFPDEFSKNDHTAELKKVAIDRADHVICISENTKLDLMRLYGTETSKISVVHLGVDNISSHSILKKPDISQRPFLLYVGKRGGYKNFAGFLKAVATSKRLLSDFDIIAFGGGEFSSDELFFISSLGFVENQVQHETGDDGLLRYYYSSARALVYPSLYEGFGLPPLEAMAHHCPVISSNTSSMPEVIGSAGEYFDPANVDDLQRAIESVVYSDDRVEQLMKLGVERLTAFSWDKCAQQSLDIYRLIS